MTDEKPVSQTNLTNSYTPSRHSGGKLRRILFRRRGRSLKNTRTTTRVTRIKAAEKPQISADSLNPLVLYHGPNSLSRLEFDLTLDPSHILKNHRRQGGYSVLTPKDLSAPVTTPSMTDIFISCPPLLPWTIHISHKHEEIGYLTIGDLFNGLYKALRTQATRTERHALSVENKQIVRAAWAQRCRRQGSLEERSRQRRHGIRRVDYLGPNTGFRGLSTGSSAVDWVMHVGPVKKQVKFHADS